VVDDKPSKELEALKRTSQILTNAKVCDDSNLTSCNNWGVHLKPNIHILIFVLIHQNFTSNRV
jgi:hypothetical protein